MGTRADFYLRNEKAETKMQWLGSIAWDGYPDGIDKKVLESKTEEEFVQNTNDFLKGEESASFPLDGWPWPWNDSTTTDYAYIFEGGKVMASCFGSPLFDPLEERSDDDEEETADKLQDYFPDMSAVKNVQLGGNKSGLIIIGTK